MEARCSTTKRWNAVCPLMLMSNQKHSKIFLGPRLSPVFCISFEINFSHAISAKNNNGNNNLYLYCAADKLLWAPAKLVVYFPSNLFCIKMQRSTLTTLIRCGNLTFYMNDQSCESVNFAQKWQKKSLSSSSQTKESRDEAFIITFEWSAHVGDIIPGQNSKSLQSMLIYIQSCITLIEVQCHSWNLISNKLAMYKLSIKCCGIKSTYKVDTILICSWKNSIQFN